LVSTGERHSSSARRARRLSCAVVQRGVVDRTSTGSSIRAPHRSATSARWVDVARDVARRAAFDVRR
jgi:hypothetical protein